MVKIRLSRIGKKNRPFWRIVAVDSRDKRDGAFLENLGSYDPIRHEMVQLHVDSIQAWITKGAQCSSSVKKLVRHYKSAKASAVEARAKEA